jgi:putative ABC transport system permease protein
MSRDARRPGLAALFTSGLLIRRRLRGDAVTLLGIVLLIAITTALAVAVPSQLSGARDRAAREEIETAGRDADLVMESVLAGSSGSSSVTAEQFLSFAGEVPDRLPRTLADASEQISVGILGAELDGTGPAGDVHARIGVLDPSAAGELRVVAGELPAGGSAASESGSESESARESDRATASVAVSAATAEMAGLRVGDTVTVGVAWLDSIIDLRIVGVVETEAPSVQRWADLPGLWDPQELASRGIRSGAAFTVLADPAGFDAVSNGFGEETTGIIRTSFDPAKFSMDRFVAVRDSVDALETSSTIDQGTALSVAITSDYENALSGFLTAVTAATAHLSTLAAGLLGVAVLVTVLASTALAHRRRATTALLRSRGASIGLVAVHSAVEAVIVTLLGTLLGVGAALVFGARLESVLLLGVAVGVVAAAPVISSLRQVASTVSAPRAAILRIAGVCVVIAATITAVAALRGSGSGSGSGGGGGGGNVRVETIDPLALAAPVLCAAVVALALAPLPAAAMRLISRLTSRTRGSRVLLASSSAREGRSIVTLIALTLASSVAITSLVLLQTVAAGQEATSWRAVGADIRIDGAANTAALRDDFDSAGSTATALTELRRVEVQGGARSLTATILAVDDSYPRFLATVPAEHRGFDPSAVQSLLARDTPTTGTERDPVPVLVGSRFGDVAGSETVTITVGDATIPVTMTEATLPEVGAPSEPTMVVDRTALLAYLGAMEGGPGDDADTVLPLTTVLAAGENAGSVMAGPVVTGPVPANEIGNGTVMERTAVLAELRDGALVSGISAATTTTLTGTALLAALALIVTTIVGVRRRGRTLALLGALGVHKRAGITLVSGELLPLVISGTLGGAVASAVVLAVAGVAFRTDVLAGGPTPTVVPLWLPAVILGVAAAASVVAVLVDIPLSRRVRTADILRTGEES